MQKHETEERSTELPLYVPVTQVAALIGLPYSTVAHHVRKGLIPSTRINERGRRYVHRDVVIAMLSRGAA
jgi:DNA-binding transcriptional MerR regulator